jgi:hypothetical protein
MPVWPYRGPLSTSGIENLRDGPFRKERPAFRIEIGNDGWSWPTGAPTTTAAELARLGLRGPALDEALRTQACRQLRLTSLIEQLPDPQNRVTLDPTDLDIYGVPLPRLAYSLGTYVEAGLAMLMRRSSPASAPRRSSIGTSPKAPDTSLARLEWAAIRQARWSTATSAATTIRISSSSVRPSSRPLRRPIPH